METETVFVSRKNAPATSILGRGLNPSHDLEATPIAHDQTPNQDGVQQGCKAAHIEHTCVMSRLADYFVVVGVDRAGECGECCLDSLGLLDDSAAHVNGSNLLHPSRRCIAQGFLIFLCAGGDVKGQVIQRFPVQDRKDAVFPEGIELVRLKRSLPSNQTTETPLQLVYECVALSWRGTNGSNQLAACLQQSQTFLLSLHLVQKPVCAFRAACLGNVYRVSD